MPREVERLAAAVRAGCDAAPGTGRPEAVLREHVQPAFEAILASRGVRARGRDEVHLSVPSEEEAALLDAPLTSRGRADAVYNRFVIEFEPPNSLRPSVMHSATRHAVSQVQQYLRGIRESTDLPLERLAGCAFDGSWIVYVRWELGEWHVQPPRPVDRTSLLGLLEVLESLATGRGLTPENLYEDFGPESDTARALVPALTEPFVTNSVSPRARAFFEQWKLDLGNASGLPSTVDVPDWLELCASLGVPESEDAQHPVLFALQTYFGIVSKLVCLVVLEGATRQQLLTGLTNASDTWAGYSALENGELTRPTGALNAIEPGIFSWYLDARTDDVAAALQRAAEVASEYSAEVVEIGPIAARDVMKDLFQRLLPRSLRHRLGEYYTPDWLAEFVLDQVGYTGDPDIRLLDPACGSGTFLVMAIDRIRIWFEEHQEEAGLSEADLLQSILHAVTGFDLSPLAVMAARTNYLIAISDLLRFVPQVEVPVYLCDSILTPVEYGDLFTGGHGKVLELKTSVGSFLVPREVALDREAMSIFSEVLEQTIHNRLDFDSFVQELRRRKLSVEDVETYRSVFDKARALAEGDVNGIWAHIIRNAFAALLQERADVVVGNPPWVFWNTLPSPYREEIKEVMVDVYKLASGSESTMRRLGSAGKDISALFVYVALDRYLRDGGRLGFVITQTLFQSTAATEFRRWKLPDGTPIGIGLVDDWVKVAPFKSATNKTATFVATRGEVTTYPVKYRIWEPAGGFDRDSASLSEVLSQTIVREAWAHPANARKNGSLWVVGDSIEAAEPVAPTDYRVRLGVETKLESAYRVRVLGKPSEDRVLIENIRDRAKIHVPAAQCEVEATLLHPYITGASITMWKALSPGNYVVPHTSETGMKPLSEGIMKTTYPLTYSYLSRFRKQLEGRSLHRRWGKTNPFYALYDIGAYTFAPWKVVWKRTTKNFEASVVSSMDIIPGRPAVVVPNGKVMMIPFAEPAEAHYVCGVLNSSLARARINAAISSEAHSEILELVQLPKFNTSNDVQRAIGELAATCQELAVGDAAGDLAAAEQTIDSLVGDLWGGTKN